MGGDMRLPCVIHRFRYALRFRGGFRLGWDIWGYVHDAAREQLAAMIGGGGTIPGLDLERLARLEREET